MAGGGGSRPFALLPRAESHTGKFSLCNWKARIARADVINSRTFQGEKFDFEGNVLTDSRMLRKKTGKYRTKKALIIDYQGFPFARFCSLFHK